MLIKKRKKKHDKVVLLAKAKCKVLTDSNISHDEFVSVKNLLKEYDCRKEEINKNLSSGFF